MFLIDEGKLFHNNATWFLIVLKASLVLVLLTRKLFEKRVL